MKRFLVPLLAAALLALPVEAAPPAPPVDSLKLEKALQGLEWKQFRTVIEAVPELRAEVEKYGPLGWSYVQSKYQTHGWKKNIDRLDAAERQRLAQLIQNARKTR